MDQLEIIVDEALEKVQEVHALAKITRLEQMEWELLELEQFLSDFMDKGKHNDCTIRITPKETEKETNSG